MKWVFPIIIIALNFGAAGIYAYGLDWRHALYFFAAAILNITVIL